LSAEPSDEPRIDANEVIIRRINPHQHVVWDENRKVRRVSSKAYTKSAGLKEGMSVDIESLLVAAGIDPKGFVTTPVYIGSVAFSAISIRNLHLWIGFDPVPNNAFHGQVWPTQPKRNFTDSQKSGLANAAAWYVEIPGVDVK
jgi:hypothetical protein